MESGLASSLEALEFDVPCDKDSCTSAAVAMLMISHSTEGCWSPVRKYCIRHADNAVFNYGVWLSLGGSCAKCCQPVVGSLSQNYRVINL